MRQWRSGTSWTEARGGRFSDVTDTVQRITGREPRRFETYANELAASLRYTQAPARDLMRDQGQAHAQAHAQALAGV